MADSHDGTGTSLCDMERFDAFAVGVVRITAASGERVLLRGANRPWTRDRIFWYAGNRRGPCAKQVTLCVANPSYIHVHSTQETRADTGAATWANARAR